ncbi:MAG TPA: MFS transporter [Opitutaceae bacterium]|jgi:fucose permease
MNAKRLFLASKVALIVTAMSFAIRGGAASAWATDFHLTHEQVGWVNGAAFWGFTLAMVIGGPLCDALGLGRIMALAFVGHIVGILVTIFATGFGSLYAGTLIFGIANGSVEAACNPLIATLYPNEKTIRLNHFHVWFPGGIVIGGVVSYFLSQANLGWKPQFATMLIPLVIYGIMFVGQGFPKTERVQRGISTGKMWAACFNPMFIIIVICMLMTATTELVPGQWIPDILTNAGVSGILVLAFINGIMAIGRQCSGPFVHKISPIGMLIMSTVLSALGLFLMSRAHGGMLFGAAFIFALGVCFFWPTMLGYSNERFPDTGALGLSIMGGAGMLAVNFMLPVAGASIDKGIALRLPAGQTVDSLSAAPIGTSLHALWMNIQGAAGLHTLGRIAILPVILFFVFVLIRATGPKGKAQPIAPEGA